MGLWRTIYGTMRDFFQIGGPGGPGIKRSTNDLQIRDKTDATLANLQVGRASTDTHAPTYLDLKERVYLIEFSFDGGSPPAPGTNTGKYGFCHTDGGGYTAGAIYLDTGTALSAVTIYKRSVLMTTDIVTGTVSLITGGVYIAQTAAAPYTWTLKGDGAPASIGLIRAVRVNVTTSSASSTTVVPTGATVMRVYTNVTAAYDVGTIAVAIGAVTLQATTENDPLTIGAYTNDPLADIAAGAVVTVTVAGGPSMGAASVFVEFASAFYA